MTETTGPAVEVAPMGAVRDGFLLVSEGHAGDRSRRWISLDHIIAIVEYPDVPGRCGVYAGHDTGWMCDLPAETLRQTVAWWKEQQRRLGALRT